MKANRKFLKGDDEAVSPVIAVILMVAITVVLAATVYVWVSGFGAQSSNPAKTISLTSDGPVSTANSTDNVKVYTVASASPGLKYTDLSLTLDGATVNCEDAWLGTADNWRVKAGASYADCSSTANPDRVVSAGDQIEIYDDGGSLSGKTLRLLDANANSVMLTLTIG